VAARFTPWIAPRPCWHCQHWAGMTAQGTAALCANRDCCRVRAMPANGCSCWSREPGSDDEPEAVPAVVSRARPPLQRAGAG
jgi:hypothetical protein